MPELVLSIFPGLDLFGHAFKLAGFCVVQGGDYIFGGDIRTEHYPPGKFTGVIGGPPCQAFSRMSHMTKYNGREPKFGNLIPEFERVVREAEPQWFVMENVQDAPEPVVDGYGVHSFILNNRQTGDKQNRRRRISFGWRGSRKVLMLDVVALEHKDFEYAAIGGSHDGSRATKTGFNGKKNTTLPFNIKSAASFAALKVKQGYPPEFDIPAFTVEAKCKAVGNSVPLSMGLAIAKAVREAVA